MAGNGGDGARLAAVEAAITEEARALTQRQAGTPDDLVLRVQLAADGCREIASRASSVADVSHKFADHLERLLRDYNGKVHATLADLEFMLGKMPKA